MNNTDEGLSDEKIQSLNKFKERRELWQKCLLGDDTNAIANQMNRMMWNSAIWRFINECRKIAPRDSNDRIQLNGMISKFVDECFSENQLLHIRRLTDTYPIDDNPKRDVYSLVSLLDDLIKNSDSITRENIFLSEDREYNVEKAREEFFKKTVDGPDDFFSHVLQPNENFISSEQRHKEFDFLSGIEPQNRTRMDSVRKDLLVNLKKRIMDASQKITLYSNKFIAHSATPESRQIQEINLVWNDLWNAQKLITQTVCFLNHYLFKTFVTSFIPVAPSNKFEFLEYPLVLEKDLIKADEMWDKFGIESKEWKDWNNSEFLKDL